MIDIAKYFGKKLDLKYRKLSYNFIHSFLLNHWDNVFSPESDKLVPIFRQELSQFDNYNFAFLLCHSGYIPEEYGHDSSAETIYSKLVEALVQEWALRIGFDKSTLPKQKSSKEDVTIQDDKFVIVCDAKSFRLGRSQKAPNVKDALKEGDIAKWLNSYKKDVHIPLGGMITFPSQHDWSGGSDFYLYLTNKNLPIVCLFYEHLAYFLIADIKKEKIIDLYQTYNKIFPEQLNKSDKNRAKYWEGVLGYLFENHDHWNSFYSLSQDIIKEKVFHTIFEVKEHLEKVKVDMSASIPDDMSVEELKRQLVETKFNLKTFPIHKQLICIQEFRSKSEGYFLDE